MSSYTDTLKRLKKCMESKDFRNGKKSGDYFLKTYIDKEFIDQIHYSLVIDNSEYELLTTALNKDAKEISRGDKSKIKRILVNKIQPLVKRLDEQSSGNVEHIDLGIPTVASIVAEIESKKFPVKVQNGTLKNNRETNVEDNKESNTEEVKKETTTEQVTVLGTHTILKDIQIPIYNILRNKMYSKDKITLLTNQKLDTFISGLTCVEKDIIVDAVICDRITLRIIGVVVICEDDNLGKLANILGRAQIHRFIVRYQNNVLNMDDIRLIEEAINNMYAPICNKCGLPMRQKENLKTKKRFYACIDSKKCRYTIDIED